MKRTSTSRAAAHPVDLALEVRVTPGDTYEWSKVLLARAHSTGRLELTTSAWETLLGYGRREFTGKTLSDLMHSRKATAAATAAILDECTADPVKLKLRCRDGRAKRLTLHRRFDAHEHTMFIVAEEATAPRPREIAARAA